MFSNGLAVINNRRSILWRIALAGIAIYETAKAGIKGMTRAQARDPGIDCIRVTCVVPGGVRIPWQFALWHDAEAEAAMLAQQCLKARIDPPHVAAMALFLASDAAAMCTAHGNMVDAGWS